MPVTADMIKGDWTNRPVNYHTLTGWTGVSGNIKTVAEFICDNFQPDFHHPARMNRIQLIKGAAMQLSLPKASMKTIDIVAVTRRFIRHDGIIIDHGDILRKLYYINVPEQAAPFPTEFLTIRRDYLLLTEPNGEVHKVRFAEAPVETISKGINWRLIKSWTLKFFYVGEDIDMYI